ncbi:MAG: hypothetical protein QNJ40_11660 [Xanthomonadales bacterium]|nr:hypothetical protein [Xanthomonadales bacterium]
MLTLFYRAAAVFAAVALLPAAGSALAQGSLEQLIERNIEARGGYQAWKSVQSLRLGGVMTLADGSRSPVQMEFKRPGRMRMEFQVQGLTGIQALDGQAGWYVDPGNPDGSVQTMSEQQLRLARGTADFEGPLIDWQEKGHQLSLEGSSEWSGESVYRIRLIKRGGEELLLLLDTESFLEIGQVTVSNGGQSTQAFTAIGDHSRVGPLVIPFSLKTRLDQERSQTLVFDSVEIDVDIPDSRFEVPDQ